MAIIRVSSFSGCIPKLSPRLLENEQAQVAENCQLERSRLDALRQPGSPSSLSGATVFNLSGRWLSWAMDVDIAKSFVYAENKRFMWTGDSYPKVSDLTIWPSSKRLGVPKPTQAPSVEFLDNPDYTPPESTDEDGNPVEVSQEDIEVIRSSAYVYTAVNDWGEESMPSDPSPVVDVRANQIPKVINMHKPEKTGVTILKFYLYRTVSGSSSAQYQFVDEVDATYSYYVDSKQDADTGDVCDTTIYTMPPDDLKGIFSTSHGMLFGFRATEVWVSEAFIPYAWPEAYKVNTEDDVVGVGGFGSTVVACTETRPYVLSGVNPDALTTTKCQFDMACLSKDSIVSTEAAVIFAAPDGLIAVAGPENFTNLTKDLYSKEQWMAMGPANLVGIYYDSRYYGFFKGTGQGFILDFNRSDIVTFSLPGLSVADVHYVPNEDVLYLHDGSSRYAWEGGTSKLEYTWRSKVYYARDTISLTSARVSGGDGATFRFFVDDVQVFEGIVTSDALFRLPGGVLGQRFFFEISGTEPVDEVAVATSNEELVSGA